MLGLASHVKGHVKGQQEVCQVCQITVFQDYM